MNRLIRRGMNLLAARLLVYAGLYLERVAKPVCCSGGAIAGGFLRQMREGIAVG